MTDNLGDRIKAYEAHETNRVLLPRLPVIARIDGRAFSTFTTGLPRPYDARLHALMVATTTRLMEEFHAVVGYTQSDEITLVWDVPERDQMPLFGGKVFKLTSILAATATAAFHRDLAAALPEKADKLPTFDCRVFVVPSQEEAANAVLWRELDATKNAISMAARTKYIAGELHGKSGAEMQEMLFQKGTNFNDYPAEFKRGTFVRKKTVTGVITADELVELPPKHHARLDPNFTFTRARYVAETLPRLLTVTNRVDVILRGADPELAADTQPE